jgi:2-methylcitrate dehydratase PrpD
MNATRDLAQFAASLRYEDIPDNVLRCARDSICDTFGAISFGHNAPFSEMLCSYASARGAGGRSRVLVPGGSLLQAPMAALVNGALAHAFELDGAVKPSSGAHPGACGFPSSLAVAQERGFGGRALLTAFVAASEVMLRIATATGKSNERRGYHGPSTTGPFAAAIAAGHLLGFDTERMSHVLGVAASLCGGLDRFARAGTGSMVKRLHFGRANESGLLAAFLVESGFEGPDSVIEGECGFLQVFCDDYRVGALTDGLGRDYLTPRIYMKRFACHGVTQAALQALEELQARRPVAADDVAAIEVHGLDRMVGHHGIYEPKDPMIAQYSVPFAVALSFLRDPKDPRSFDAAALRDPSIMDLCQRVRLVADNAVGAQGALVRIHLRSGEVVEQRVSVVRATPSSPATRQDVFEKFALLLPDRDRRRADTLFSRLQAIELEDRLDWIAI